MAPTHLDDMNSWQLTASRSSHPSQRTAPLLGPGDLLVEIAAGMGGVAVPVELVGEPSRSLSRELVLTTPAYDVWVMHWPSGESADLHAHDQFVAYHVVSGQLVEERVLTLRTEVDIRPAGSTTLVPPHTMHRLASTAPTTTVHVHAKAQR
jgi:mannose-6-phosphate isomerase-like protein (cupin superfamily)